MSEEKKREARKVESHLEEAQYQVTQAEKSAQKVGDKTLIQKVTKIREAVTETRKELGEKLKNG